ncbi:MAG: hypothetical protein JEZ06_22740 [Anaerolineaceae bacterium]|nr:hypothetical protein [Anaerolineaceae bacterium]
MENWIENGLFENKIRNQKLFSNHNFKNCHFQGAVIGFYRVGISGSLRNRTIIQNIRLIGCKQTGCAINGVILKDILVDGLETHNLLIIRSSVLNQVTLKGKIGEIMITPNLFLGESKRKNNAFLKANTEYYSSVDWALDISEAQFSFPVDIRGIPARLVKRDPITQAVVKLNKAKEGKWKKFNFGLAPWSTYLSFLVRSEFEDIILTAPKNSSKLEFNDHLDGIKKLRDTGIADID